MSRRCRSAIVANCRAGRSAGRAAPSAADQEGMSAAVAVNPCGVASPFGLAPARLLAPVTAPRPGCLKTSSRATVTRRAAEGRGRGAQATRALTVDPAHNSSRSAGLAAHLVTAPSSSTTGAARPADLPASPSPAPCAPRSGTVTNTEAGGSRGEPSRAPHRDFTAAPGLELEHWDGQPAEPSMPAGHRQDLHRPQGTGAGRSASNPPALESPSLAAPRLPLVLHDAHSISGAGTTNPNPKPIGCAPSPAPQGPAARIQSASHRKD
jgi:hypothetical protein